jgi:hypothetical protein
MKESLLLTGARHSRVHGNDSILASDLSVGEGYALCLLEFSQTQATPVFLEMARCTSGQDLACEQAEAGTKKRMHQCCECRTTKSHKNTQHRHSGPHIELRKTEISPYLVDHSA